MTSDSLPVAVAGPDAAGSTLDDEPIIDADWNRAKAAGIPEVAALPSQSAVQAPCAPSLTTAKPLASASPACATPRETNAAGDDQPAAAPPAGADTVLDAFLDEFVLQAQQVGWGRCVQVRHAAITVSRIKPRLRPLEHGREMPPECPLALRTRAPSPFRSAAGHGRRCCVLPVPRVPSPRLT